MNYLYFICKTVQPGVNHRNTLLEDGDGTIMLQNLINNHMVSFYAKCVYTVPKSEICILSQELLVIH